MFIASLFIIAKKWKPPKCQVSSDEWTQNVVYPYDGILFDHKKEGNANICYSLDRP